MSDAARNGLLYLISRLERDGKIDQWTADRACEFVATITASRASEAALQARVDALTAALETIRSGALAVVGASEAYGETENVHLWQEMADTAEAGLWPAAASGSQEGQAEPHCTEDRHIVVIDGVSCKCGGYLADRLL